MVHLRSYNWQPSLAHHRTSGNKIYIQLVADIEVMESTVRGFEIPGLFI